jgi:prepilin-type N-terminal cleavage/methylation domain-containing protein
VRIEMRQGGFTLIELIVVILLISILAAGLAYLITGIIGNIKITRTESLIQALIAACEHYKSHTGKYPPLTYMPSSVNLYHYLNKKFKKPLGHGEGTGYKEVGPFMDFKSEFLEETGGGTATTELYKIIDAWGNELNYENPCEGVYPGTCGIPNHQALGGIRIWSHGPDPGTSDDDIISCKLVRK